MTTSPTIDDIRAAIAAEGSIRAAGRKLDIAESTLRRRLKAAEVVVLDIVPVVGLIGKGRPTPKAPQNRPRPVVTASEPSDGELAFRRAKKAKRAQRAGVAPIRRALKGQCVPIIRTPMMLADVRRQLGLYRIEAGRYARQDQAAAREAREAAAA